MVTKRTFWISLALEIVLLVGLGAVSAQYSFNQVLGYGLTPFIRGFTVNNRFSVIAYGAKCDGVTDDTAAIQAAENAACAARPTVPFSVEGGEVYFPSGGAAAGGGVCQITAPIIGSCLNGMTFNGDPQATINGKQIGGPALFLQNSTAISMLGGSAALVTPALVGSGNSITWPAASPSSLSPFFFDAMEGMGGGGVATGNPFNGDAAFSVRFFFKLNQAPNNQWFIGSDDAGNEKKDIINNTCGIKSDGIWSCPGAFGTFAGSDSKFHARITIGGTQYFLNSGTTLLSSGVLYEGHLDYDGTNIRLILNGVLRAFQAATGTITQRPDENTTVGWQMTYYPLEGPINGMQGTLDSIEIAKVSRNNCGGSTVLGTTCYAMDTAKFPGDSNSQFLENFTTVNLPSVRLDRANGTDTTAATGTNSAYMMLRNFGLGSGAEVYQVNNLVVTGAGAGLGTNATQYASFNHDFVGGAYYGFMDTYNASFGENFNDFTIDALPNAQIGMMAVGGIAFGRSIKINVGYQTTGFVSGSGTWDGIYIGASTNCLFQFLHPDTTQFDTVNINLMSADNENSGNCPAIVWNGSQNLSVHGSALGGVGAAQPAIRIEAPFFENVEIDSSTIQADPAAADYIDFRLNAFNNLHMNGLKLDSDTYIPKINNVPSLPYSNFPSETVVINSNGSSQIPTVTAGTNGAQIPQAFGAVSGSLSSTTGTTNGTASITSVASTNGWLPGMGIAVLAAGPTSTVSAPSTPTGTAFGGGAGHTYAYKCAFMDGLHGLSAASIASSTVTNGASLSFNTIYNEVAITPPAANSGAYSVGCWESKDAGAYTFVTFAPVTAQSQGTNAIFLYDYGQSIASTVWPSTPPGSATADDISTTIASISGSTFTLATALTQSITATLFHDDCNLINQASATNVKVQLPAATYACSEPWVWGAAGANSFPNIEGAGAHQSIIQTTHAMGGLPVILLINPNSASLHDFGIVGDNSSLPSAGIESFVNNPTGFGAVGHSKIDNVEIASSNTNAILNGVVFAAANGFDENNEAWKLSNTEIMQVREAGVLIDHYNSLQNEIVGGNFIIGGTCGIETFGGDFYVEGASNLSAGFANNANDICIGHGKYGHDFGVHQTLNEANVDVLRIDANASPNSVVAVTVTLDTVNFGSNTNDNTIDIEPPTGWYLKVANSHIGEGLANATYLLKNVRAILEDNVLGVATINCSGVSGVITTLNNIYTSGAPTFTLSNGCTQSAIGSGGGGTPAIQSWPLSQNPVTGTSFYCNNCDPPTNPPSLCSSSFSKIGSNVRVTNGQYVCGP